MRSRAVDISASGKVFPWGISDIGPVFGFWLIDGDPSRWTVVLADRFTQWRYRGSLSSFLADVLSGHVTCPLLPANWPDLGVEREVQQLLG
jgi:hypothetical protein